MELGCPWDIILDLSQQTEKQDWQKQRKDVATRQLNLFSWDFEFCLAREVGRRWRGQPLHFCSTRRQACREEACFLQMPLGQSLHQAQEVIWGPQDTPGPCSSPEASWPSFRAYRSGRETQSLQTTCVARQKLQGMVASYEKLCREKVSLLRNAPPDHPAEIVLALASAAIPQLFSSTFDFLTSFQECLHARLPSSASFAAFPKMCSFN